MCRAVVDTPSFVHTWLGRLVRSGFEALSEFSIPQLLRAQRKWDQESQAFERDLSTSVVHRQGRLSGRFVLTVKLTHDLVMTPAGGTQSSRSLCLQCDIPTEDRNTASGGTIITVAHRGLCVTAWLLDPELVRDA